MNTEILEKQFPASPVIQNLEGFEDADDELRPIAKYIKDTTTHNADVEPNRIKFLYSDKPKKQGGRYGIFTLVQRSDMEKMVSDSYDYILIVFYDVWKDLTAEGKVIQLDKALCGIDMGDMEKPKLGKKSADSQEFTHNMNHYSPKKVMQISETVHLAVESILEQRKEQKKMQKEKNKEK